MKNTLILSVGITAYNEANTIADTLRDILAQEKKGWELGEILVYTDGCTDNTVEKVKSIRNSLITIIEDKKRKGKTARLRQMFQDFSSDILVMFDGDIRLQEKNVITQLIQPLITEKKVMLVGGNALPFAPKTFFQKAVFTTFSVFYQSRLSMKKGNNVFGCSGQIMGITKALAKKIVLPNVINEDAYIYLYCISNGYQFRYVDSAKAYYKLPQNAFDHIRQVLRSDPRAVTEELETYYGRLVREEFYRPLSFYFMSIFTVFIQHPFELITIVCINAFCKLLIPFVSKHYKLEWFTATSTH